jgi:hypothetical protein
LILIFSFRRHSHGVDGGDNRGFERGYATRVAVERWMNHPGPVVELCRSVDRFPQGPRELHITGPLVHEVGDIVNHRYASVTPYPTGDIGYSV